MCGSQSFLFIPATIRHNEFRLLSGTGSAEITWTSAGESNIKLDPVA